MITKRRTIATTIAALALTGGLVTQNASAHLSWFLPSSTGSTSSLSNTLLGSLLGGASTPAKGSTTTTPSKGTTTTPTKGSTTTTPSKGTTSTPTKGSTATNTGTVFGAV